ncbi:MAG: hypothetical protein Q9192_003636 [Flavoplaca navasiana]
MSGTYTLLAQSENPSITLSIQKQPSRSSLLNTLFPARTKPPPTKRTPATAPPKVRGIVGKDPGELSIRAAMARKKAFQLESFENGDYGAEIDIDGADNETDEEEMEKEMEEMRFLLQYQSQDLREEEMGIIHVEGRERGERKSLAGRLLRKSA